MNTTTVNIAQYCCHTLEKWINSERFEAEIDFKLVLQQLIVHCSRILRLTWCGATFKQMCSSEVKSWERDAASEGISNALTLSCQSLETIRIPPRLWAPQCVYVPWLGLGSQGSHSHIKYCNESIYLFFSAQFQLYVTSPLLKWQRGEMSWEGASDLSKKAPFLKQTLQAAVELTSQTYLESHHESSESDWLLVFPALQRWRINARIVESRKWWEQSVF